MLDHISNGLGIHPTGQDASNVKPQPTSPAAEACLFDGRVETGETPICLNFLQSVANPQPLGMEI